MLPICDKPAQVPNCLILCLNFFFLLLWLKLLCDEESKKEKRRMIGWGLGTVWDRGFARMEFGEDTCSCADTAIAVQVSQMCCIRHCVAWISANLEAFPFSDALIYGDITPYYKHSRLRICGIKSVPNSVSLEIGIGALKKRIGNSGLCCRCSLVQVRVPDEMLLLALIWRYRY